MLISSIKHQASRIRRLFGSFKNRTSLTDLSAQKQRPVIAISNDDYNQTAPDILVVAMTSKPTLGRYSFPITSADLAHGQLNRPGTIRVDKIYSLDQQLTRRIFGRVNQITLERITALIQMLTTRTT